MCEVGVTDGGAPSLVPGTQGMGANLAVLALLGLHVSVTNCSIDLRLVISQKLIKLDGVTLQHLLAALQGILSACLPQSMAEVTHVAGTAQQLWRIFPARFNVMLS